MAVDVLLLHFMINSVSSTPNPSIKATRFSMFNAMAFDDDFSFYFCGCSLRFSLGKMQILNIKTLCGGVKLKTLFNAEFFTAFLQAMVASIN